MDILCLPSFKLSYEDDIWVLTKGRKKYEYQLADNTYFLLLCLPLLEYAPVKIIEQANNRFLALKIDKTFQTSFPLVNLLKFSLESHSIHWVTNSLKWIEALGIAGELKLELTNLLDTSLLKRQKNTKDKIRKWIRDSN